MCVGRSDEFIHLSGKPEDRHTPPPHVGFKFEGWENEGFCTPQPLCVWVRLVVPGHTTDLKALERLGRREIGVILLPTGMDNDARREYDTLCL